MKIVNSIKIPKAPDSSGLSTSSSSTDLNTQPEAKKTLCESLNIVKQPKPPKTVEVKKKAPKSASSFLSNLKIPERWMGKPTTEENIMDFEDIDYTEEDIKDLEADIDLLKINLVEARKNNTLPDMELDELEKTLKDLEKELEREKKKYPLQLEKIKRNFNFKDLQRRIQI